jgi:hypothetical protein
LDDDILNLLSTSLKLNTLDISFNNVITDKGANYISNFKTLKVLMINHAQLVTIPTLVIIVQQLPFLEWIEFNREIIIASDVWDIIYYFNFVHYVSFIENVIKGKTFSPHNSPPCTDHVKFEKLSTLHIPLNFHYVRVANCIQLTDLKVAVYDHNSFLIIQLGLLIIMNPSLVSFEFSDCDYLEVKLIWYTLASFCSNLTSVNFYRTDIDDSCILFMVKKCKFLHEISLVGCEGVTNVGLNYMLDNLHFLHKLCIADTDVDPRLWNLYSLSVGRQKGSRRYDLH